MKRIINIYDLFFKSTHVLCNIYNWKLHQNKDNLFEIKYLHIGSVSYIVPIMVDFLYLHVVYSPFILGQGNSCQ